MTSHVADPATATPPPRRSPGEPTAGPSLAVVGLVVFAANAGLLVLQLVAGRHLVPFVGSSLETWTAIIGVFLAGIALGNAVGGRIADRAAGPKPLAGFLLLGAAAAAWAAVFPKLLAASGVHTALPIGPRILLLALVECFPAGFALSLLTPVAVKLGLPDVSKAGRAAGRVFALGTVGCLVGNYATGFVLVPAFSIDAITYGTAAALLLAAPLALFAGRPTIPPCAVVDATPGVLAVPVGCAIVFVCSFAGMALELTATRILAQVVGVSLFTWTGVIGVMLAGTAAGNWAGGVLADRRAGRALVPCLLLAAAAGVLVLVGFFALGQVEAVARMPIIPRILLWSFALFFLPMLLLGTISPQVIRLAVGDPRTAGRIAGRVYAWSTAGAIAGTFAAGYLLISHVGMYRTVLGVSAAVGLATGFVPGAWDRRRVRYALCPLLGTVCGGAVLLTPANTGITRESNYFTVRVDETPSHPGVLRLQLDVLVHSWVKPADPTYLHYPHEQVQLQFLRHAADRLPAPRVLVVGGGGYTFPRAARTLVPSCAMDVVEIDPAVTEVSYTHLGLDPALGINAFHQDGRRFVAESAAPGSYDLITLDAVNDLSVPYHLLTAECNAAVKAALAPGGVYLVTVIDSPARGRLWKAAMRTLGDTFAHVELLTYSDEWKPAEQNVYVLYAADVPLDLAAVAAKAAGGQPTRRPPAGEVDRLLAADPPTRLTDQFAPVDQMMADVLRTRPATAAK